MSTLVEPAERIAVVRANGLGDLVFSLPALDALRRAYPAAEITLIGRPHHRELFAGRPGPIDRVEVAPPYGGVTGDEGATQDSPELDEFFRRARAHRYDLALQIHGGGGNSNRFTHRLGARFTAGFRAQGAPPLDRWARYSYFQNEIMRYLEAVALVGVAAPPSLAPRLAVTPLDREQAGDALGDTAEPLALLNPGATDSRRRWPPPAFAQVGRALREQGLAVAVSGDEGDAPVAAAIADAVPGARCIAGTMSLGGLLGVLERATVVVSNDTGPLHLASAVGTPTVGIYWCGNLVNGGPVTTTRHRHLTSWRTACPDCGTDCMTGRCDHGSSFVAEIAVDAVLAEIDDLLATVPATASWAAGVRPPGRDPVQVAAR